MKPHIEKSPYNRYAVINEQTHTKLSNKLSSHYIELGNFTQEWIDGDLRNNCLIFFESPTRCHYASTP
jgi:hypothetical protein